MSLWTPSGEHPVNRDPQPEEPAQPEPGEAPGSIPGQGDLDDLDPEERARAEALAAQLAEARERLASVPAATVVANHAMGLYELAAIHLGHQPPKLTEARVAIDAMHGMLEATKGLLGEDEPVLTEALHQLRMAFVQLGQQAGDTENTDGATPLTED